MRRLRRGRPGASLLPLLATVLLAPAVCGCRGGPPPSYAERSVDGPSVAGPRTGELAGVSRLIDRAGPAIVRVRSEGSVFKPVGVWGAGLAQSFFEALNVLPIARLADDWLGFLAYLVVGPFDLESRNGSGVVVSGEGHVVTNAHVIANAAEVWVERGDGLVHAVSVEKVLPEVDLALLKLEPRPRPRAEAAAGTKMDDARPFAHLTLRRELPRPGDAALVIGYPGRDRLGGGISGLLDEPPPNPTATFGIVSAIRADLGHREIGFIQIDAALNPGNSGGAVLDADGQVRGIAVARGALGKENEGYAIPAHVVLDHLGEAFGGGSEPKVTPRPRGRASR